MDQAREIIEYISYNRHNNSSPYLFFSTLQATKPFSVGTVYKGKFGVSQWTVCYVSLAFAIPAS